MTAAETSGSLAGSIPALLEAHAGFRPRAPAIASPGRRTLTFRQLVEAVQCVAEGLSALGFGRGARIALVLPDGADLAVASLGVSAGAVATPLDPRLTSRELGARFAALDVAAVIVREGLDSPARPAAQASGLPLIELSTRPSSTGRRFLLRGRTGLTPIEADLATPADAAFVLQTSGTTGAPKTVVLTHHQLCASARNVVAALALTAEDRCLNVMPLFHVHGLVGSLLASLTAGAPVTCVPEFSALRFFTWIDRTQPTWYTAAPAMHQAILRLAGRNGHHGPRRSRLRLVRSSSAPLAPALAIRLEQVFGVPVIEAYGMTEAAHQVTSNPLPPDPRKPGSVGLPVGVEVEVLDGAHRRVSPGQFGEIAIRGATVSHDAGDGVRRSGTWLQTGDVGYLDPDGYLFITGRLSDAINRGGEKIFPREVDAALLDHPAVADAVAIPLADPELGEEVGALVVLQRGACTTVEQIREFLSERLAPFKVPRRLELVAKIPRQATGKVARRALAESFGSRFTARSRVLGTSLPDAPSSSDGPSARAERVLAFVRRQIEERRGQEGPPPTDETSLIRSGLFDSMALVELAEWIGREAGEALAPDETRLLAECDTIGDFVRFLEDRRSRPPARPLPARRRRPSPRASTGYRFEPYRPEWRDGLLALQRHHWGPDADLNAALFEWKYEKNPYVSDPLVFLAIHDDRVVGMRGYCAGLWEIGRRPRRFRALSGGDLVVSPMHRDRGIVHGILTAADADLARRGFKVLFNFSAGRATYLASLATGWRATFSGDVLRRHDTSRRRCPSDDVFVELDGAAGHAGDTPISIDHAPKPAAMRTILDRVRGDGRLGQVRDDRYLAWRYENPMARYRFLFWHERRSQGYLVLQTSLRLKSGRGSRVNVLEWAATSARARDGLLRCAAEWGAFPELRVWAASVSDGARRHLAALGFRPPDVSTGQRPSPSILVRLLDARGESGASGRLDGRPPLNPRRWDLRMAYSDGL